MQKNAIIMPINTILGGDDLDDLTILLEPVAVVGLEFSILVVMDNWKTFQ